MTDKEIIRALRLCSCETSTRNCPTCPLSGNDDCVTDALREAADIIERLTAENTALREGASLGKAKRPQKKAYEKSIEFLRALTDGQSDEIKSLRRELEWKDMVIALAQREQAKAEAVRDALLEYVKTMQECEMCKNDTFCHLREPMEDDCQHCQRVSDCPCQKCEENNCWEWRGLPEAPEEGEKA